jgi:hypothetical protein
MSSGLSPSKKEKQVDLSSRVGAPRADQPEL